METVNKYNIGLMCVAICIAGGLLGFGKFSFPYLSPNRDLIEVKGLSEKIIDSDIAEIKITIRNTSSDMEFLYKKKKEDKQKVLAYLKDAGFENDIYKSDFSTYDYDDNIYENGKIIRKEKVYTASDEIFLKTTKFDQIENLKSKLSEFCVAKIALSYDCIYRLTDFKSLKLLMLNEAAKNARDSANAFLSDQRSSITGLAYLKQGEITINSDTQSASSSNSPWESEKEEKASFRKKVRLVVRAGFKHD